MAFELHIPYCVDNPPHPFHPPPPTRPVRINIEGSTVAIERLLPGTTWSTDVRSMVHPQPAGLPLAQLTYQALYGYKPEAIDVLIRSEYIRRAAFSQE